MKKLFLLILFPLLAYSQTSVQKEYSISDLDPEDWVVMKLDAKDDNYYKRYFDKYHAPTSLSADELSKSLTILLNHDIDDYRFNADYEFKANSESEQIKVNANKLGINIKAYKIQFLGVIDKKGNKEVKIGGYCKRNALRDKSYKEYWTKVFIGAHDGGVCYFHAKINLSNNTCEVEFNVDR